MESHSPRTASPFQLATSSTRVTLPLTPPTLTPPTALVLPVTTALDIMAEEPYMSHDNKFVTVLLFFFYL